MLVVSGMWGSSGVFVSMWSKLVFSAPQPGWPHRGDVDGTVQRVLNWKIKDWLCYLGNLPPQACHFSGPHFLCLYSQVLSECWNSFWLYLLRCVKVDIFSFVWFTNSLGLEIIFKWNNWWNMLPIGKSNIQKGWIRRECRKYNRFHLQKCKTLVEEILRGERHCALWEKKMPTLTSPCLPLNRCVASGRLAFCPWTLIFFIFKMKELL